MDLIDKLFSGTSSSGGSGGGGGVGFDYIFWVNDEHATTATVLSGSFSDCLAKLQSGMPIIGKVFVKYGDGSDITWAAIDFTRYNCWTADGDIYLSGFNSNAYELQSASLTWHADGTIEISYE